MLARPFVPPRAPRRRAPSPRRSDAGRAVARLRSLGLLLVAVGLLVLQVPRLTHLLLVSHAVCEHGSLVEHATAQPAQRAEAGRPSTDAEPHAEAARADGGAHDHCDLLGLRHLAPDAEVPVAAPVLLPLSGPAELRAHEERRPESPLSLAPKASPPTA